MSIKFDNEDEKKLREVISEYNEAVKKEEYNFCDELINEFGIKELKNDSLYYQLDMFISACNMNIYKGGYSGLREGNKGLKFVFKDYQGDDVKYHFEITRNLAIEDDSLSFRGEYNDLNFSFDNYYKKSKLDDDIKPIPFMIQLKKEINNKSYYMAIRYVGSKLEYELIQNIDIGKEIISKHVRFLTHRNDLESSFEIIHLFAINPEALYSAYESELYYKNVFFSGKDVNSIQSDDLLVTKSGKCLKKAINN